MPSMRWFHFCSIKIYSAMAFHRLSSKEIAMPSRWKRSILILKALDNMQPDYYYRTIPHFSRTLCSSAYSSLITSHIYPNWSPNVRESKQFAPRDRQTRERWNAKRQRLEWMSVFTSDVLFKPNLPPAIGIYISFWQYQWFDARIP